ncbi:MAG TPA: cytochrome c [candidate division Zixibacteria bacterium]|nr:cytochrome c [candidate division Zixibacteria bacterium]
MTATKLLGSAAFLWAAVFWASHAFAQADTVAKRQQLMKDQSAAAKAIKAAAESKDYATVELKAKDLMGSAEKIPGLFPKGSNVGKTKAKAEIWEMSDDFAKRAKALGKAAGELASAAKSKDDAAIQTKIKAVSGACGGCHKAFRAEKYAE